MHADHLLFLQVVANDAAATTSAEGGGPADWPSFKPESTEGRCVGGLLKEQKGAPLNLG